MPIVWRDAFNTGNQSIDADHRHLLTLINTVENALTVEQPLGRLLTAIDKLEAYTREHFAREERLMIDLQYAKYDRHKAAHLELIEQLNHAAKPIRELGDGASQSTGTIPADVRDDLVGLIRHWLVDHIIKEDMLLKPLLSV